MTSPNLESVAADSNVLLSAIAGKAALRVFAAPDFMIVTTDANVSEVLEYVPEFAARYGLPEETLVDTLALLPIEVYSKRGYYSNVATTGAWSLVPISRYDGQETARSASDSLAST